MTLDELVTGVADFATLTNAEQIKMLGWYLHQHCGRERFDPIAICSCYDKLHLPRPTNVHACLKRLTDSRPPALLRDKAGYRLEGRIRTQLDARLAGTAKRRAVSSLLADLPRKISILAEQSFINEAIACFRSEAFRAAIVMTWIVAYDHLLNWIHADGHRLAAFNTRIDVRFPKRVGARVASKVDFEDFKESEVLEIASSAALFSKSIAKILKEKLTRRNLAAHPTEVTITAVQAEDVVTDLVNNVILAL